MDAALLFDIATKAGASLLTLVLIYACYVLWMKLDDEQQYTRKRDAEILLLLTQVSAFLTQLEQTRKESQENILRAIGELQATIIKYLMDDLARFNDDENVRIAERNKRGT